MIFETLKTSGHEQVLFCNNPDAGLQAIIAIHNTVLGPALGGIRMRPYADETAALNDVLRLSRTMTYKNALAGLNVGGGKTVIIGDATKDKTEAMFRALGRCIDSLGGRYIGAEDAGTNINDLEHVYRETEYVVGVHQAHGGSGDPAPFTAYGALQALMATLNRKFGNEEIGKYSFAVQGLGHIGMEFVKLLRERGAKLFVTDLNATLIERAVEEYGAEAVKPDEIYGVAADVFSPCAFEYSINEQTLPRLKAKVICGTANNQMSHATGVDAHARGILYAPDYAVNAGAVMNVSLEIDGYNRERAMKLMRNIYHTLGKVFDLADKENISPQYAADRIAETRIEAIGKLKLPLGRTTPRFMGHLRGEH
jgi:leucine dehydrogenase